MLLLCANLSAVADEAPAKGAVNPSSADALKAAPDDRGAWQKYMVESLTELRQLIDSKSESAEKKLSDIKAFVAELSPKTPVGKQSVEQAGKALDSYAELLTVSRMPLEELGKQLQTAPDDAKLITRFILKISSEIGPLTNSAPDKAEELLAAAKATFQAARHAATSEEARKQYESQSRLFSGLELRIASGKKLAALVGKDAAPLKVDAWVNGTPMTDADLKGKVVLLDFWAIWCGPCIATFPHLREWNEKYGEKGLVIVGLTNYYGFEWDQDAGRAVKAAGEVSHEQEHEMLKKFAAHHELKHRFAVQTDRSAAEYYEVSGIPHVVVIDQAGKVRMIRVGSGEANAKDIGDLLAKLLGSPKVAGK